DPDDDGECERGGLPGCEQVVVVAGRDVEWEAAEAEVGRGDAVAPAERGRDQGGQGRERDPDRPCARGAAHAVEQGGHPCLRSMRTTIPRRLPIRALLVRSGSISVGCALA